MNILKALLPSAIFLISTSCVKAQVVAADSGNIEIIQEYKISELVSKHIELNAKSAVKGYRIKIHFGSDKARAREVKARFILLFPEIKAYEKYDQPNFNIRVGDFRSKLDAYRVLKIIQAEFPSAFIVQDDIELSPVD